MLYIQLLSISSIIFNTNGSSSVHIAFNALLNFLSSLKLLFSALSQVKWEGGKKELKRKQALYEHSHCNNFEMRETVIGQQFYIYRLT